MRARCDSTPGNHRGQDIRQATELFAYVAASVVSGDDNTADPFNAEQALRFITFLTIGYMISRGLTKAGSRSANRSRLRR